MQKFTHQFEVGKITTGGSHFASDYAIIKVATLKLSMRIVQFLT